MFDFQLRQLSSHSLLLRLDLHGAEAALTVARCRRILKGFSVSQGLAPIRVAVETGQILARGHSSKLQRVVAQTGRERR